MGYNFRELFYYLFQDKENYHFAFDLRDDMAMKFCVIFYLNSLEINGINRLLDDNVNINIVSKKHSFMNMFGKEHHKPFYQRDLDMFRDSFNRPGIDLEKINAEYNDPDYWKFDVLINKEDMSSKEHKMVSEKNKDLKLPYFFQWTEGSNKLAETFPNCILVEKGSNKRGEGSLFIKVIENGKVRFPRKIK